LLPSPPIKQPPFIHPSPSPTDRHITTALPPFIHPIALLAQLRPIIAVVLSTCKKVRGLEACLKLMGRKIQKILNAKRCASEKILKEHWKYAPTSTHHEKRPAIASPSAMAMHGPFPQSSAFAYCLPFEGQTFVSTHSTNSQQCL